MSRWKYFSIVIVTASLGALGCHKSNPSGVSITISPTVASVITNETQPFSAFVTGAASNNTNVTWKITCASGVTAPCGSFSTTGTDTILYTAPATIPTTTSNVPAPAVTVTATSQADTSKSASASLTLVTGISITITPTTATVGTTESFAFVATVSNPGCNLTANPTCENVTFSLSTSTSLSHQGTVTTSCATTNGQPTCTGLYTADSTVPTPSTVVLTATSVADTSVTATVSITIESAQTPTVSSVSPNQTALGALFQDVFIAGTNFISTSQVFVNGVELDPSLVSDVSSSVIRARIPDYILAVPPASNTLQIGVAEEGKTIQNCSDSGHDESLCQITVTPVRPGVVGTSPPSIPQGSGGQSFSVDGGFFGAGANPAVTATFNGQVRSFQLPATGATGSTRQLTVSLGGSANPGDFLVPGLYPVQIASAKDSTKIAVSNLAVQPSSNVTPTVTATIPVGSAAGSMPSDVAINPATGIAVVANSGSNDVSLIDLTPSTGPVLITNICTVAVAAKTPCPSSPSSGPSSVAVDYVRNIALVVNAASKTIAVIDLSAQAVTSIIPMPLEVPAIGGTPGTPAPPEAVGINPVTGRALVTMQSRNYGVLLALLDLSKNPPVPLNPPAVIGVVTITTGPNTRVGIEPNLNWAIATPGGGINGVGSIGIVDLGRQSTNSITNLARSSNLVTVTVDSSSSAVPLAVHLGDAVQIQNVAIPGISDASTVNSFDGIYTVSALGPSPAQFTFQQTGASLPDVSGQAATGSVNYSQPVTPGIAETPTIQGLGINPETQQAVLVDPANNGVVSFFSLIDQTLISTLTTGTSRNGPTAAAYNPLTNAIYAVDSVADALSVIAPPTTPGGRGQILNPTPFPLQPGPVAIAIDPGTNTAVIANQKDNSATVLALGSIKPLSIVETSPKTALTTSTLGSGPAPTPLNNLTVIGQGFTCGASTNPTVRLDGQNLQTFCDSSDKGRKLTATVPPSMLSAAHRYALDVSDLSGNVTNAATFLVEQSIDVSSAACPNPFPSGVAIDPQQNLAAVGLFGCGTVALINLTAGTGQPPGTGQVVTVGTGPLGVATVPRLHLAVVANNGSSSASVVDEVQHTVTQTVTAGSGPQGAGSDNETGEVAVANSVGNSATVVNASTLGVSTVATGSFPVAAAYNYVNHELAVANEGSNTLTVIGVTGGSASSTFSVNLPTSVAYDPVPSDCVPSGNTTTTNTVGCFLVNSSTQDLLEIIDPLTSIQNSFRFGINPTAIAYNFLTSTAVSTNTASHTMTVADLPRGQVRSVFSLPLAPVAPSLLAAGLPQLAVDVHPFLNLAVVADTANGRVLFIPLPF